jgi:hypothetical protein
MIDENALRTLGWSNELISAVSRTANDIRVKFPSIPAISATPDQPATATSAEITFDLSKMMNASTTILIFNKNE